MREIIFRGKRVNNDEWVEGGIIPLDTESGYIFIAEPYLSASTLPVHEIVKNHMHLVVPESVGQFTGLYDKNNTRIFEGDTVKNSYGNIKVVEYHRGYYYPFVAFPEYTAWDEKECEVVGNAYDFLAASNKM